ncbi:hypothetical protein [Telluribacter sp.]|jgi:hypothetical protein|uniref:hypothetical protein n=1 Tax=Telluribacter sp. TaxID=1978767 RepID=UPI002E111FC1|nr:hypothetical protein [Telluribacter sp.]
MKTYITLLLVALGTIACNSDEPKDELGALAESQCTYVERKTTSVLTNEQGAVRVTTNPTATWVDIYLSDDPTTPYCPCNIPESFTKDGLRVEITAELKETYPNERWRCQPVVLKAIKILSTEPK